MNDLNYVEMGQRIKIKRKQAKITQETLAEIIDVSPSFISEIERGTSICSLQTITKIAQALNTSLDYLIFGITLANSNTTFFEILKTIPEKNHKLYISLCENIANSLRKP